MINEFHPEGKVFLVFGDYNMIYIYQRFFSLSLSIYLSLSFFSFRSYRIKPLMTNLDRVESFHTRAFLMFYARYDRVNNILYAAISRIFLPLRPSFSFVRDHDIARSSFSRTSRNISYTHPPVIIFSIQFPAQNYAGIQQDCG